MTNYSFYRRNLPHYRMKGATYFVTWRIHPEAPILTAADRGAVAAALKHFNGKRYDLLSYVVMDNHVHVIVRPRDTEPLEKIIHSWKSFTARQINLAHDRRGACWLSEYMDRIVRNEEELEKFTNYVLSNPKQRWPEIQEYPWVEEVALRTLRPLRAA